MKSLIIALATSACVIVSATVSADSWPGSRPQVYTSANGSYRFKTRPPQLATWSGRARGKLVAVAPDGTETAIWTRELVNIPVSAFIADDGRHVVTLDTWARLGYEHALVIFGGQGAVVADYDLDALLSADEIASSVVHTVSARRWLQGATITFDKGEQDIVIHLQWGKRIRVELATGKIETAQ
jgi:hypothetical protein